MGQDFGGAVGKIEDSGNPRAILAGTDHVGRSTATKQEPQGIHHDGFTAAGFAGQQVLAVVEPHAQPVHHGIVLNHQLVKHSFRL